MNLYLQKQGYSFSPGKIIITGEHSVVYGHPAIVAATQIGVYSKVFTKEKNTSDTSINKNTNSNKNKALDIYQRHILQLFSKKYNKDTSNLRIDSKFEIPIKSGMGSSAAYAHSIFLALVNHFQIEVSQEKKYAFVFAAEKFIHGKPSGIDPFAVVYGGIHLFQKDLKNDEIIKEKLQLPKSYSFILIDSGQATESTGEMVALVAKNVASSESAKKTVQKMGIISQKIKLELLEGSFSGQTLDENHQLLESLGVVGKSAQLRGELLKNQGFSVKVTGAGGVATGSGLLLTYAKNNKQLDQLRSFCSQQSWDYWEIKVE